MYETYWQLQTKPFEQSADTSFYYPSELHQGALLKLRYAFENRRSAALLVGPSGMGKTLLARSIMQQLPDWCSPKIHLVFPQMPADQIVAYVAAELAGDTDDHSTTVDHSVRRISKALTETARSGRHTVLIIDEAHLLHHTETLETIRLLLNFEHDAQPALTLLLVGQPSLLPILERSPELDERISVKCLLRHFSLEETISYISLRLHAAGAQRPIFDQGAMEAVHHLSDGVPRRINRLCDLAMLVGYAEERGSLAAAQVESVAQELVVAGTAERPPQQEAHPNAA